MTESNNPKKRRALGRGLGALISNSAAPSSDQEELIAQAEAGGIQMLTVDRIAPNPHQPRAHFDETNLRELAVSIEEHGIIQPLIVTQMADQPQRYWLVAGERRWRAAKLAGLDDVPVIVREASPQQLLEWALVENVQRSDLNPLEEAAAYQSLIQEFDLTQAEVADRVGKSRSTVANAVRLLQLPPRVQAALTDGLISAGHARTLLALPAAETMERALETILARELNVRQTEALVRSLLEEQEAAAAEEEAEPPEPSPMEAHLRSLEERFRSTLGTKVRLDRRSDGSGRLVVHFFSDADLDNIYRQIVGDEDDGTW